MIEQIRWRKTEATLPDRTMEVLGGYNHSTNISIYIFIPSPERPRWICVWSEFGDAHKIEVVPDWWAPIPKCEEQ